MKLLATFLFAAGAAAFAGDEDRALIAQTAADRTPPPAPIVSAEEAQARAEMSLAQARLELVLARKALAAEHADEARERVHRAKELLAFAPAAADISVFELQAAQILARLGDTSTDGQYHLAASVATLNAQDPPADETPAPTPPPVMVEVEHQEAISADAERLHYLRLLSERVREDESRILMDADAARIVPAGDVEYPEDFAEKVARRKPYDGGQVARSESWRDAEGREWYAAVYDIRDITYEPPDFEPSFSLNIAEQTRNELDREALRQRSRIFSGDARDLAAGIPLLHYFGGVNDRALRGPKYSPERQREVAEMIRAFTERSAESKIILTGP